MKLLKYTLLFISLLLLLLFGFMGYSYDQYQDEQSRVRSYHALAFEGYSAIAHGQKQQAQEAYEKAVALYDKESSTLTALADIYQEAGDMKRAGELYTKAYHAKPDETTAYYNAALCDYAQGAYRESIAKILHLVDQHKKDSAYYKLLVANYFKLGENAKAFGYLALLDAEGRYRDNALLKPVWEAYDALDSKPTPTPFVFAYEQTDDPQGLKKIIDRYIQEGKDLKALATARKLLMLEPTSDYAHLAIATLLANHKALKSALPHLLKVQHHTAKSWVLLGGAYQKQKVYDKALSAYEKGLALSREPDTLRAMVVCALKLRDGKRAFEYLNQLEEMAPRLAHKLRYALEINAKIKHTPWQTAWYLLVDRLYEIGGVK